MSFVYVIFLLIFSKVPCHYCVLPKSFCTSLLQAICFVDGVFLLEGDSVCIDSPLFDINPSSMGMH